jgi:cyanophycin synthetase
MVLAMKNWTTVALHGPNRWSPSSVLELHAEPKLARASISTSVLTGTVQLLSDFLDAGNYTTTHPQSVSAARESIQDWQSLATRGVLWDAVARWMSAMAGVPSRHLACATGVNSNALDTNLQPVAALEMEEELLSLRAFEVAKELIDAMESGQNFPISAKFRELFDHADDVRLGPSSRAILDAALERGIPYYRMTSGSLCQLGEGKYQRRIWTAETDATSAIAESIASDKDLTKRLLHQVGVPIPLGRLVTSPEDAWTAAQQVGFPVVVKPRNANHQRGISIELTEKEEIIKAYHWAIEDGQTEDVMVEQFARGEHHRLLVVGNRMIAASRGHVETVTGDGIRTVQELVDTLNQDPRRGEAYTDPLGIVKLVAAAHIELTKQGLAADSIPETGRVVLIQRTGDLTTDCTEEVHPETARQAVLAAQVVGLDIAGLDILAEDISRPLSEQRGAVVEVNAGPSLSPHVTPLFGKPRPVGQAIIDLLFQPEAETRIPITCVVAVDRSSATEPFEAWRDVLSKKHTAVGSVESYGIRVGDEQILLPEASIPQRVQALLSHPSLDALLIACELKSLEEAASPVPRIDRLIVVSPPEESVLSIADRSCMAYYPSCDASTKSDRVGQRIVNHQNHDPNVLNS